MKVAKLPPPLSGSSWVPQCVAAMVVFNDQDVVVSMFEQGSRQVQGSLGASLHQDR